MNAEPRHLSSSVILGYAILDLFKSGRELGVRDVAAELDLPVATAHRYLRTLLYLDKLCQAEPRGPYRSVES